jgi:hypothetical protein
MTMTTLVLIVLVVLVVIGLGCLINAACNGCPFAWIWLACGGMGHAIEFVFAGLAAIASGLTE